MSQALHSSPTMDTIPCRCSPDSRPLKKEFMPVKTAHSLHSILVRRAQLYLPTFNTAETTAKCSSVNVLALGWNRPRRVEGPAPETGHGFFGSSVAPIAEASRSRVFALA